MVCVLAFALNMVAPLAAQAGVYGDGSLSIPPVVTATPDSVELEAGTTKTIEVAATVAGAELAVTLAGDTDALTLPDKIQLDGEGKGTLAIKANDVAAVKNATITLTVEENGLTGTEDIAVKVTPLPVAPVISVSPASLAITKEAGNTGTAVVTVQDVNDPQKPILSVKAESDNEAVVASPGALTLDGEGRCTLELTPAGALGTAAITITAENEAGESRVVLQVEVLPPPVPPAITVDTPALTLEDDETATVAVTVADGNSPPLDISGVTVASSDAAVLDPASPLQKGGDGRYLLPIDPAAVATRQVVTLTLTATNTAGKSVTETVSVTVDPATIPPAFHFPDEPFVIAEDGSFELDVESSAWFERTHIPPKAVYAKSGPPVLAAPI